MNHVGIGYDVHQLVQGRKLILGGVEIPHARGLDGHSDADALLHAITDAILGALGESDIGHFFPNTDPRWKNAPSRVFLEEAARQVAFRQGRIVNIDATVIAQQPKLAPHIPAMKLHIAEALGIPVRRVGLKATTNEHLGFVGRDNHGLESGNWLDAHRRGGRALGTLGPAREQALGILHPPAPFRTVATAARAVP
jgi:2-C-methyl-D-erythritol 2,4-cyclodiphosphate synthase